MTSQFQIFFKSVAHIGTQYRVKENFIKTGFNCEISEEVVTIKQATV